MNEIIERRKLEKEEEIPVDEPSFDTEDAE